MKRYSRSNGKRQIVQQKIPNKKSIPLIWVILLWSIPLILSGLFLYRIPTLIAEIQNPKKENNNLKYLNNFKQKQKQNKPQKEPVNNSIENNSNDRIAGIENTETVKERLATLYFCQFSELYAELVKVQVKISQNENIIKQMLKSLINPPAEINKQRFQQLFPEGTKLLGCKLDKDKKILTVNFNENFQRGKYNETGSQLKIGQIVHSMTSLQEVDMVIFKIDNKKVTHLGSHGLIPNRPFRSSDFKLKVAFQ